MATDTLFKAKAPGVMVKLMHDFAPFTDVDAAAVLGNVGHECGGFRLMQEIKPLVPGSRGGWGWCQWTGPRRRSFEAWAKARNLDPSGDPANYGFLVHELRTSEAAAIPAVRKAKTLRAKVEAFELNFERAGIKHYDARMVWANKALAEYRKVIKIAPAPPPPDVEPVEPKPSGWLSSFLSFLRRY
jgi:hypothetical protein